MVVRRFVLAFALVLGTVHCADHPSDEPERRLVRRHGRLRPLRAATTPTPARRMNQNGRPLAGPAVACCGSEIRCSSCRRG